MIKNTIDKSISPFPRTTNDVDYYQTHQYQYIQSYDQLMRLNDF